MSDKSDHDLLVEIRTIAEMNQKSFEEFRAQNAVEHERIDKKADAAHRRLDERDRNETRMLKWILGTGGLTLIGWTLFRVFTNSVTLGG